MDSSCVRERAVIVGAVLVCLAGCGAESRHLAEGPKSPVSPRTTTTTPARVHCLRTSAQHPCGTKYMVWLQRQSDLDESISRAIRQLEPTRVSAARILVLARSSRHTADVSSAVNTLASCTGAVARLGRPPRGYGRPRDYYSLQRFHKACPTFEEAAVRFRRALEARDLGALSAAQALVRRGAGTLDLFRDDDQPPPT
jgi:hypothetical protein